MATIYESAPLPPLAKGDKVRHLLDIEKGFQRYGLGTVEGQDKHGDWVVWFPQRNFDWETTFSRHWLQKVEE